MNSYMIEIDLPEAFDNVFISLIPRQRIYISQMLKKGIIANYSLSSDRKKIWVIVNAEDGFDAKNIIFGFPIYKYITFKIHNLLFHESNYINSPQLWLN